jgi:multidrug efflux pump subunit AcrB
MWIVRLALARPYTFIVMALAIVLATPITLVRTPVDVLPVIDIPVISVIWSYNGLSAEEMANRITTPNERNLTVLVSNIQHSESQSLAGIAIIKLFLQPHTDVRTAMAQAVSAEEAQLRFMPPGATPPLILTYSASSIPVLQLGISSPLMSEQALNDAATNFLRPQLVTIPGTVVPFAYGGKPRVISVDLDTGALLAKGLTPSDVINAVNAQNLILPSGTAKIGATEYSVTTNASPDTIDGLNRIPVRTVDGATTYLSEVAHVRDGFSPQTNVVRQDGHRGVLMSVMKSGEASTLSIVDAIHSLLPHVAQSLPPDLKIVSLFDQSVFVKAAVQGVAREAVIAAALTAAMVLLFLGNWRSTLIIAISIPLSILASLIALSALGESINIMTLGGLALAVGILVDDATVTIENIERHLHRGSVLRQAILDGAGEIAVPAFVSTLSICIVFVPMFFLTGVARYLFVPLAEAVVFAMLASYLLSRTLVPTLALLLTQHPAMHVDDPQAGMSLFARVHRRFQRVFDRLHANYVVLLTMALERPGRFGGVFLGGCLLSTALLFVVGTDFFPSVDSGAIRLHLRGPTGLRIEETARLADQVENVVREVVPLNERGPILDNLGLPYSGINLSYSNAGTIGTFDGELMIALAADHAPAQRYIERLRAALPQRFPGIEFFFQPADIVTQILNFGLPAAIDVQIVGANQHANFALASRLMKAMRSLPGTVDVHIQQRVNEPTLVFQMDRSRLQQLDLTAQNVAQNLLVALSGSSQTAPAFWLNERNGVQYPLSVQMPQYDAASLDSLMRIPVTAPGSTGRPQLLGNLVRVERRGSPAEVSHYNIRPAIDVLVSVQGRDLGSVAREIDKLVAAARPTLTRGSDINVRGQVETMRSSFSGLYIGLAVAVVLVYLLIVVNFQSWLDPLIIISALPAALAGIAWMLFLTGTRLSVPALTGGIMTVGVATANSILVVSFARERLTAGATPIAAALEAGGTRMRPVLMTATAMIAGMLPMALGIGEAAEQNAPLGRAVIGGLLFATVSTLVFVPVVFSVLHGRLARKRDARHAS